MPKDIILNRRFLNIRMLLSALALALLFSSCTGSLPGFRWTAPDGSSLEFSSRAKLKDGTAAVFGRSHTQDVFSLKKSYGAGDSASLAVQVFSESGNAVIGLGWTGKDRKDPELTRFSLAPGRTVFFLRLDPAAEIRSLAVRLEALAEGELAENAARIESAAFHPGFTGYELRAEGVRISDGIGLRNNADGSAVWTLHPFGDGAAEVLSIRYALSPGSELTAKLGEGSSLRLGKVPGPRTIRIPLGLFQPAGIQGRLSVTVPDSAGLEAVNIQTLTAEESALIDPGLLLLARQPESAGDFAWYRWDLRPDVLMLDFKSYEIQDKYLKRLAFFVEKKGFTGRLAGNSEIQSLHGWNAHDYRAEDVARFFTLAASSGFDLNPEELRLRDFFVEKKLISRSGNEFKPGKGAVVSVSMESPDYLRRTFLTHELSHAIFFSDAAYERFVTELWNGMGKDEKWFWILYFGWMNYNTSSSYLMANELQAYLIQQSIPQARDYFTKVLPERLLENHKELEEPIRLYMEKFASSFESRAAQIDGWLRTNYGFGAGRLYFIR